MAARGRPKSQRAASAVVVQIKLRLYPEDGDLVEFFASVPLGLRAAMVKRALRSGICESEAECQAEEDAFGDLLDSLVD